MKARVWSGLIAGVLLAALAPSAASGAVALQPVGSFSAPDFITSPPGDQRLFVVERDGRIKIVKNGTTLATDFLDIDSLASEPGDGERGLLSMAFDPNYASNGLFYVDYTENGTAGGVDGDIHVDEFKVSGNPDVASLASRRQVLTINRNTAATNHNGGQLQFGKDGFLYISVGEAATSSNAQTTSNLLGKILRIDPHGSAPGAYTSPATNPFVGQAGARPEIWSLGLRNPFRFSFDHLTGDIAIGDVGSGSSGFEEVNFATQSAGLGRGVNYGWPMCEGPGGGPSCAAFTPPVFSYPHGSGTTAIIGGYVYRGTQVPELTGRYIYADLGVGALRSVQLAQPLATGDRADGPVVSFPNSFGEDSNCELYVAAGGAVSKIVSTSPPAVSPGCTPAARIGATLELRAKKHRVRRRHRAKLRAVARPCPGVAGETVELFRGKKKIGKTKLDGDCKARFAPRVQHRSKFTARLPETPAHLAAASDKLKVSIKH